MSEGLHFPPSRLLALAQCWRHGAGELRRQFGEGGHIPFATEVAAETMEICAHRLEQEVADWYARQRTGKVSTLEEPPPAGPALRGPAPVQTDNSPGNAT